MNPWWFNLAGLWMNFFGCILLVCDSLRTSSRFSENSVFFSYPVWRHPAWRLAAPVGFIFVTLGFGLLLPAAFAATKQQPRNQKRFTTPLALIARLNLLASLGGPREAACDEIFPKIGASVSHLVIHSSDHSSKMQPMQLSRIAGCYCQCPATHIHPPGRRCHWPSTQTATTLGRSTQLPGTHT